jgi:1,4-dihydroxy-2-naphthoate octaprenyltransferase
MKIANPWAIAMGFVYYALGGGILHYLGRSIDPITYWLGQAIGILFMLGGFFLKGFFDESKQFHQTRRESTRSGKNDSLQPIIFLEISLVNFGAGAGLIVLLLIRGHAYFPGLALLLLAFGLMFFYSMPPMRLAENGFGEFTRTVFSVIILPALGYVLQTNNFHRLLPMITFPLAIFYLSMELALSLQSYGSEMWGKTYSLMGKIGWQRGMSLHNLLLLIAYLLIGIAALFGQPWSLTWPLLLSFPVSVLQILIMLSISNGAKPHWHLVEFCAYVIPSLSAYLIGLTLWSR